MSSTLASMEQSNPISQPTRKKRAAITSGTENALLAKMYTPRARERINQSFDLRPGILTSEDMLNGSVDLSEIEVLFGTWGFPELDASLLKRFKNLEHIFFGAGSIKRFGLPILEAGIPISSSKGKNAEIVADFCLGQILLAAKNYFQSITSYKNRTVGLDLKDKIHSFAGYSGSKIGLIGCGKISRYLIELLKRRNFQLFVVDPYLTEAEVVELEVTRLSMDEAFEQCHVISNHLPNLPELKSIINKTHFERMPIGATFMNTGRGAQIVEEDLIEVFEKRSDLIALLDVTEPEPPTADSKLYTLNNILLSSHIAGCVGEEVHLLIEDAIESAEKWIRGETLDNVEQLEQFNLIA